MDNQLNIIEIIDGKYILNYELLKTALTSVEKGDKIALISIAGPKNSGKTFFINCLINYMNSKYKDQWPNSEDTITRMDNKFHNGEDKMKPVVKLTSKPFVITEEIDGQIERIAIFLMDSDFVFDCEMSSQIEQNILALFLLTSSTVIYNQKRFVAVI